MKKILIGVAIAALIVSCGTAPSGLSNLVEDNEQEAAVLPAEGDGTNGNAKTALNAEVALNKDGGDDNADGMIAGEIDTESAPLSDAKSDETDLADAAGTEGSQIDAADENVALLDEGEEAESGVAAVIEVPNVEFDENGHGVVVSHGEDDWDESLEDYTVETYRVAERPIVSEDEETLLNTRYDEAFREPPVALIIPPPLSQGLGNRLPLAPIGAQKKGVQTNKTNKGQSKDKASNRNIKASFATPMTASSASTPISTTDNKTDNKTLEENEKAEVDGEQEEDASPVRAAIASGAETQGENAQNLPILPKSAAPSNEKSEVFVTEYRPDENEDEETDDAIEKNDAQNTPSRKVTIKMNQYLDVVYPGAGWVYLGENKDDASDGKKVVFKGRKLGETETQFTLRAQREGKAVLHFYKNDVLTNSYIDDYLEVEVTGEVASSIEPHATAPSYAAIVPPRPLKRAAVAQSKKAGENADKVATEKAEDKARTEAKAEKKVVADVSSNKAAGKTTNGAQTKNTVKPASSAPKAKAETSKAENKTAGVAGNLSPAKTVVENANETAMSATRDDNAIVASNAFAPSSAEREGVTNAFEGGSVTETHQSSNTSFATPAGNADEILQAAQKAYNGKRYADCLKLLSAFFDKATSRIDEGLYLEGLSLEGKSNAQNIKGAIDTYDILMKNWPASKLWNKARERSIYLKRMYIDIR